VSSDAHHRRSPDLATLTQRRASHVNADVVVEGGTNMTEVQVGNVVVDSFLEKTRRILRRFLVSARYMCFMFEEASVNQSERLEMD